MTDTRSENTSTRIPRHAEVVVIGAGLAGLAAAVTLADAGIDVQVLEARPRAGGRVQTLRDPFDGHLFAEAGGEFISPGHAILQAFMDRFRVQRSPIPWSGRLFDLAGRRARGDGLGAFGSLEAADAARIERMNRELGRRVPDPGQPWSGPDAADLDAESVGNWLDGLPLGPVARAHERVWRLVDYGIEPEQFSLLQLARDERIIERSPDGPGERAVGGMDRLPRAMSAQLGPRIHLSAPVSGIAHAADDVSVTYTHDGAEHEMCAERVVLCLPLSAARHLRIVPELSVEQRAAWDAVHYGSVLKVLLQCRRRFWRDTGVGGVFCDDPPFTAYDATANQPGERGILAVYTAGRLARELAQESDERRAERCLVWLECLFPGCRQEVERAVSTSWDTETGSLGAYSYFPPGGVTQAGDLLARPIGRLHVAGEHTSRWQATMNGALESGLRAAREILAHRG